jgi:hypothetical protein
MTEVEWLTPMTEVNATHGELSQAYREAREGSTEEMKHISNRNSILDKPKRMTWFCQV